MSETSPPQLKELMKASNKDDLRHLVEQLGEQDHLKKRSNTKEKKSESLVADYQDRWFGKIGGAEIDVQLATEGKERSITFAGEDCEVQAKIWLTNTDKEKGDTFGNCLKLVQDKSGNQFWVLQSTSKEPTLNKEENTQYWKFDQEPVRIPPEFASFVLLAMTPSSK